MSPVLALFLLACAAEPPAPVQPGAQPPMHGAAAGSLDGFTDAYRQALDQAGHPPCTWQNESAAARCPDGRRHDVRGLWAWVQAAPEGEAEARAQALLDLVAAPDRPLSGAEAEPLLRPRLRLLSEGVQVDLELARPGGTLPVQPADLAAWQLDPEAARSAASRNLDRVDPRPFWPLAEGLARARVGDGYDGDRLLTARHAALGFEPAHALVVPGALTAVAAADRTAGLDALATAWQAEHPDQPATRLAWRDGRWVVVP